MNVRLVFLLTTVLACVSFICDADAAETNPRRPNVVFFLIDDLGYNDIGCYGSTFHETPHIDSLAASGMRFTNGYAACPVCSPTRVSIMTGKYPARLHLTDFLKGRRSPKDSPVVPPRNWADQMPSEEVTIAEALHGAGYATGFFGKWHLGGGKEFLPQAQGFDLNIGGSGRGMPRSFFWPRWKGNPPITGRTDGEYLPDRLSDEAVKFIETNQSKPFFVYLSHYAVHIPIEGKADKIAKYRAQLRRKTPPPGEQNNPIYAAMVESVDESIGKVLSALKRLKIDENTIVIFTSDNGGLVTREGKNTPATTLRPLRAGKGYLYEGGIREPWIVRWPGVTRPGSVCDSPVISNDFFPTIIEMTALKGVRTNGPIDGISFADLLKDPQANLPRGELYWHYPHFSNQGGRPGGAVRQGDWKLIERYERGDLELYNLADDLGEKNNLAKQMPKKAAGLRKLLDDWRKRVDAQMPEPNPVFKRESN